MNDLHSHLTRAKSAHVSYQEFEFNGQKCYQKTEITNYGCTISQSTKPFEEPKKEKKHLFFNNIRRVIKILSHGK